MLHVIFVITLLFFSLLSVVFGVTDQQNGKRWWALIWYGIALWDAFLFWDAVFA